MAVSQFIEHYTTHPVSATLDLYLTGICRADQTHNDGDHSKQSRHHDHGSGMTKANLSRHDLASAPTPPRPRDRRDQGCTCQGTSVTHLTRHACVMVLLSYI